MRRSLLPAVLASACWAMPHPAPAAFNRCLVFAGTADGLGKSTAVDESQKSLREAIDKWKADNGFTGLVSETAQNRSRTLTGGAKSTSACFCLPT